METKPGKARELCSVIEEKGVPILKGFPGLLDVFCLIPEEIADSVIAISFWETRETAEKYHHEAFRKVAEIYHPFLEGLIQVRGCDVPVSTGYRAKFAKAS
jgi:heme-degrading monooxygenase HmoA